MVIDQDEVTAALWKLVLECARPSWRFRFLFNAHERQLLGFAINTFMSQRQQNLLMNKLDERYGNYGGLTGKMQGGAGLQQAVSRAPGQTGR